MEKEYDAALDNSKREISKSLRQLADLAESAPNMTTLHLLMEMIPHFIPVDLISTAAVIEQVFIEGDHRNVALRRMTEWAKENAEDEEAVYSLEEILDELK